MSEKTFSKILALLIFLTFDLMLLGAGVRTMNAGLTCPDWPLCFGQVIPSFHLGVYLEFIHRVVAGVVAVIFTYCFVVSHVKPHFKHLRFIMWISLMFLFSQIIMGGLTVLKLLAPGIVTLHLSLAGAFLGTLVVIKNKVTGDLVNHKKVPPFYKFLTSLAFVFICLQIILGGKVASTYAGSVCLDFPTCMGEWIPTLYGPIGLQVMHRLGAYTLVLTILTLFVVTLKLKTQHKLDQAFKILASQALLFVFSQVAIGILNLKLQIPAALTVVHLAVALLIYLTILKINIKSWA